MEKQKLRIQASDIAYIALFVALITVCGWISIPVGYLKYTLQLFAVLLCAGLIGWWRGLIAVLAYLFLGLIGAPVFAEFGAGLMAPTRGYVVGFLLMVVIVGLAYRIPVRQVVLSYFVHALSMVVGVLACYAFGTVWFVLFMGGRSASSYTFWEAVQLCVLPYAWFDAVKIVVALPLIELIRKYMKLHK